MNLTDFWKQYKSTTTNGSVSDFWDKYRAMKSAPASTSTYTASPTEIAAAQEQPVGGANTPQPQSTYMSTDELANMFGSYVKNVDPAKYGGYTQDYWKDALSNRVSKLDASLAGKPMILDFGGDGTKYIKDYEYGGGSQDLIADAKSAYSSDAAPKPYNEEALGFSIPLGAWVYTGTGDPQKSQDKWKRGDAQTYNDWRYVSAFDDATIDPKKIDPQYRVINPTPYPWGELVPMSNSDVSVDRDQGYALALSLQNLPFARPQEGNSSYWTTSRPGEESTRVFNQYVGGIDLAKYLTYDPGQEGAGPSTTVDYNRLYSDLHSAGWDVDRYFYDPRQATAGIYSDGKEGVLLPSAAGYAPTTDYSYGRGGFEGFLGDVGGFIEHIGQQHASWAPIAMSGVMGGIGLTAMPATTGMSLGAAAAANAPAWVPASVMGAVGQGAATGQKTNDPFRIFAGAASGAAGGALSGGALAGLSSLSALPRVATGAGAGAVIGTGNTYAKTGDVNAALRSGIIGGLSGGAGAAATPAISSIAKTLTEQGVNPTLANAIASGTVKAGTGSALSAAAGGDAAQGASSGLGAFAGGLTGGYTGQNWLGNLTSQATNYGLSQLYRR